MGYQGKVNVVGKGDGLMKKLVMTILVVLLLLVPVGSLASDGVYRSATEYDYPPFSVIKDGEADGFSVELLKAVADAMGLSITFKVDDWVTLKEELKNGDLDVLPLVGYTEERDKHYP
jgi:ABC-type amino acid transport substrate-binding protein